MSPELQAQCQEALDRAYNLREIPMETQDFVQKVLRLLDREDADFEKFDDARGQRFLARVDCDTCVRAALGGWDIFPSHRGSATCQGDSLAAGGNTAHCSCDACW